MAEPLVRADRVGRRFRQGDGFVEALVSASCCIHPRDRIAIVGASGSGKSTLLHLLAGLDTPTSGTLDWPALGARDTLRPGKISIVFQAPSLLPALTVIENVEIPLLLGHLAEPARPTALRALRDIVLAELAERRAQELFGGQAQRVAVARALAGRPKLVLADEPTGQLDRPTAQRLFDALLEALSGSDTALAVATHDEGVAARLETVWRMHHGVLSALSSAKVGVA